MSDHDVTVSDAAERLGVSRSTVLRLIEEDELDARRRTRKGPFYISEESLEEYQAELDEDDEDDLDEIEEELEQAHKDGYREGLAECGEDHDDEEDDED